MILRPAWFLLFASLIFASTGAARANPEEQAALPRTLLAFYDSREEASPRTTLLHRFLEMPANHLGYVIEYHDITRPLPELRDDVAGLLVWFNGGMEVPDAHAWLDWLELATRTGKRLIVMENLGIGDHWRKEPRVLEKANRVLARIGVMDTNRWQSLTYEARIAAADPHMVGFERSYSSTLPPYMDTRAATGASSHLQVALPEGNRTTVSDLVVTGPLGGYVAAGYALFFLPREDKTLAYQWHIDPFAFLARALGERDGPIPDTTTIGGRRAFLAQIDGDGWNDFSDLPGYRDRKATSAEAVKTEILAAYPQLLFTVSVIGADLNPECYGLKSSTATAQAIFALANVEPAAHSETHPLLWRFFADYTSAKEAPFRSLYPARPSERSSMLGALKGFFARHFTRGATEEPVSTAAIPPGRYDITEEEALKKYYHVPRSYYCGPFSLKQEISGAAERLQPLLPPGKTASLLTWTGDTTPFEGALAAAGEAGFDAIGGGGEPMDADYPSVGAIPPLMLDTGTKTQIYAGNGNEFSYFTGGEKHYPDVEQFLSAQALGERGQRIAPLRFYAHMHIGGSFSRLAAAKDALTAIQSQEIAPLTARDYLASVHGFARAVIRPAGEGAWEIHQRGGLSTLRFDNATLKTVDYARSRGVLGQRWRQGSLYVALDPAEKLPLVALAPLEAPGDYPPAPQPYLISARQQVYGLKYNDNELEFAARGAGMPEMTWKMPQPGEYRIIFASPGGMLKEGLTKTDRQGILRIRMTTLTPSSVQPFSSQEPFTVRIARTESEETMDHPEGGGPLKTISP